LTPEDLQLDPEFFLSHQPLILYRLARARYANLSGIGAAFAPGRWNRLGREALYTSTEVGVPVLERLAHTPKELIPSNLALMRIRISGDWGIMPGWFRDRQTGADFWIYRDLASATRKFNDFQDAWGGVSRPFAVAMPSVIVPVWNVVLYPDAPGFWDHVSLESVEAFEFDPRLFPENAMAESPKREGELDSQAPSGKLPSG